MNHININNISNMNNLNIVDNVNLNQLKALAILNNINSNINNNINNFNYPNNINNFPNENLNYLLKNNYLTSQSLPLHNQVNFLSNLNQNKAYDSERLSKNKLDQIQKNNNNQQNFVNKSNPKRKKFGNKNKKHSNINKNKNTKLSNNSYNYSNQESAPTHQPSRPFQSSNIVNLYKMDKETIIKEAYNLTKDQIGCRYLQKKIEEDTDFSINFIYPIIIEHIDEIIIDKFGNYLIQKFFEYMPQKDLFLFMNRIKHNFLNIGLNQYGTRVIQKIIDYIKSTGDSYTIQNYNYFVLLITPNIIPFSNDLNGCHIIQKILLTKNFDNKFCYNYYRENIVKIANDKNGCCFLQKILEKLSGDQLNFILEIIFNKTQEIIVDQYGNYLIQFVLKTIKEKNNNNYNLSNIFKFIVDDLVTYSNQKYCSNVIEKLFTFEELRATIVAKLENPKIMKALLFEKFGNYVVQKALNYSNKIEQNILLNIIASLVEDLKKLDYGFRLYNKLISKYPNLLSIINNLYKKNNNINESNDLTLGNKENNFVL